MSWDNWNQNMAASGGHGAGPSGGSNPWGSYNANVASESQGNDTSWQNDQAWSSTGGTRGNGNDAWARSNEQATTQQSSSAWSPGGWDAGGSGNTANQWESTDHSWNASGAGWAQSGVEGQSWATANGSQWQQQPQQQQQQQPLQSDAWANWNSNAAPAAAPAAAAAGGGKAGGKGAGKGTGRAAGQAAGGDTWQQGGGGNDSWSGAGGGDSWAGAGAGNDSWGGDNSWGGAGGGDNSWGGGGGAQTDDWSGSGWGASGSNQQAWSSTGNAGWSGSKETDWDNVGSNLDKTINWAGVQLIPVTKDFYHPHPDVVRRSEEEDEALRKEHDIEVFGDSDAPKLVTTIPESALAVALQNKLTENFSGPTTIQMQVWPAALQGRDIIGIAETGSGKTLAYMLPMMTHVSVQDELKQGEGPIGVVLVPTRELAIQIAKVANEFNLVTDPPLKIAAVYGGAPFKEHKALMEDKIDILVAVCGRFIHLLNEGVTNLNRVSFLVLDEADEMIQKGFGPQVKLIMSQIRPDRQVCMFSATWSEEVQELAKEFCKPPEQYSHLEYKPLFVRIGGDRLAACRTIRQLAEILKSPDDKFEALRMLLSRMGHITPQERGKDKVLVFCETKRGVDDLEWKLQQADIEVSTLHADKTMEKRLQALEDFREDKVSLLVATNCLGRGHDIPRVKMVVNYDAPKDQETYIHRIGRTGRAGETGSAVTFLTPKDRQIAPGLLTIFERSGQNVTDEFKELVADNRQSAGQGWSGWDDWEPDAPNDSAGGWEYSHDNRWTKPRKDEDEAAVETAEEGQSVEADQSSRNTWKQQDQHGNSGNDWSGWKQEPSPDDNSWGNWQDPDEAAADNGDAVEEEHAQAEAPAEEATNEEEPVYEFEEEVELDSEKAEEEEEEGKQQQQEEQHQEQQQEPIRAPPGLEGLEEKAES
mmetsp:Transcript_52000/g.110506  ORF Transcript_52000/g.110506 Transcript_52000/m.110506 type:complete len:927 (-) Transcript_52000:160-2940(-)|eukprot:CAMPEP_0206427714 /NCGR_PEP_ID=MMETSP0324_2-20121206/5210_1 /ASSEMBLY_ACC=CAM_ASM_000836 /TAXON_ID=2866 /ORGANISM="Crypthecodinium cohnii, Strain Seligo" /LENGTH=926 /DNA_ID=CAMNT_0053893057 /DNA_START=57 /DNA_END=2837 /DNA_ORIENTATION=+